MSIRLFGVVLIFFAGCAIGLKSLRNRRRQLRCLRGLCRMLAQLHAELQTSQTPLPELLARLEREAEGETAAFLSCLLESLPRLGETSFSELWMSAARKKLKLLSRRELEELLPVGRALGRFALQEQLGALSRCERWLSAALECGESRLREEAKLRLVLPAACGAMLALLLV